MILYPLAMNNLLLLSPLSLSLCVFQQGYGNGNNKHESERRRVYETAKSKSYGKRVWGEVVEK